MFKALTIIFLLLLTGCSTIEYSWPQHTATERLQESVAVQEAMNKLKLPNGISPVYISKKYYTDFSGGSYGIAYLTALLYEKHKSVVFNQSLAKTIVYPFSAVNSINHHYSILGIPSLPLPVPQVGLINTPQLSLYSATVSDGVSQVGCLFVQNSKLVAVDSPVVGFANRGVYNAFIFQWTTGNVYKRKK